MPPWADLARMVPPEAAASAAGPPPGLVCNLGQRSIGVAGCDPSVAAMAGGLGGGGARLGLGKGRAHPQCGPFPAVAGCSELRFGMLSDLIAGARPSEDGGRLHEPPLMSVAWRWPARRPAPSARLSCVPSHPHPKSSPNSGRQEQHRSQPRPAPQPRALWRAPAGTLASFWPSWPSRQSGMTKWCADELIDKENGVGSCGAGLGARHGRHPPPRGALGRPRAPSGPRV